MAEYFEQVLNVADGREVNINVVGNWRIPLLGDFLAWCMSTVQREG